LRVPVQDAMDHAAALAHDLTGDFQDFVHDGFELRSQQRRAVS
jgi:hypothetical protein